jgi:MFS family permease
MAHPAATAAPSQRVLLRFAPAVLIVFFGYLTVGMPLAVLPLHVHDRLGFGTVTVGITIGVQSLVTFATRQLAGNLCDHKGAKLVLLLGGSCSVFAGLLYLLSTSVPIGAVTALGAILVARVISGVGESLFITGSLAWSIGIVGPHNTGKVMVWVGIGMYGAVAAGAPLGIWLMTNAGGFVAVALATITFSLLATFIGVLIVPLAPHGGARLPFIRVAARIAPFGAGLTLATVGFGAIAAFAALDIQTKGWPGTGFALAGFGAAYLITRFVFGHFPDRFGGARVALLSLMIETCGQILLWLAPVPAIALVGAIMTGAGFSLVFPSFGIEAVKQVPPTNRGAALGAYAVFFDLGFAVAGPVTGVVAGAFGYPAVFAVGALSAAVAVLPALQAAKNRKATSLG